MYKYQIKPIVGTLELCNLPELTIHALNVRVDTGATTSSLHVDNIEEYKSGEELWVSFDIHPNMHNVAQIVRREAKVDAIKRVKSSTATLEKRYTIKTKIQMAELTWSIQLTLTDRSGMTYLMLLGREAMAGKFLVDPELEYVLSAGSVN
jgi:hypothetical protein